MTTLCKNHFLQQLYRKIDGKFFHTINSINNTATNKLLLLLHPFPPRCCSRVPERAQLGLCSHIPDALHPAAVYVALRHVAIRLQRPSLHLRWLARGGDSQGMWCGVQPIFYTHSRHSSLFCIHSTILLLVPFVRVSCLVASLVTKGPHNVVNSGCTIDYLWAIHIHTPGIPN